MFVETQSSGIRVQWPALYKTASYLVVPVTVIASNGWPRARTQSATVEKMASRHSASSEFVTSLNPLQREGEELFKTNWTRQQGGDRPRAKGTGRPLSEGSPALMGGRGFNRVSAPDANSCAGCHNAPYGITGGGGDFVTGVFVLGQRFDFSTFDPADRLSTRGTGHGETKALTAKGVGFGSLTLRAAGNELGYARRVFQYPGLRRSWAMARIRI